MTDPAARHFPTCHAEFLAAAVRLRRDQNLKPADIAVVLKLSTNAVRELLFEADNGRPQFANTPRPRHRSEP